MKPSHTALSSFPIGLGEHFEQCKQYSSRFVTIRCAAEAVKGFVASRLITCAVLVFVVIGLSSLAV
jgi:hypothetical protein